MSRFTFLSVATLLSSLVVLPAQAATFTTWNSFTSTTATGTMADPNGPISVTLEVSQEAVGGGINSILDSSTLGNFYNGQTSADVYEPNLPGTSDFIETLNRSNNAVYTLKFSQAVIDPIFHVFNLDFRDYNFLGGITPSVISGLNLVATGNVVGDNDGGESYDEGGLLPNKGNPDGSAYGSFKLTGTFTEISWTRPLVGQFVTDRTSLAISASAAPTSVPEPGTLGLIGAATIFGFGSLFKRKLSYGKGSQA